MKILSAALVVMFVAVLLLSMIGGTFVEPDIAVRALETRGFSNIRIAEKHWFAVGFRGCSGHDSAKFVAKVKNPAGKDVEVFVCAGWPFKGATVRTN